MKQIITQTYNGITVETIIECEAAPCDCAGLSVALIIIAGWLAVLTFCRRH